MQRKKVGLHFILVAGVFTGFLVSAAIAINLWMASDQITNIASHLYASAESIAAAQGIRASIGDYRRQAMLRQEASEKERLRRIADAEATLAQGLREAESFVSVPQEQDLVKEMRKHSEAYLAANRRLIERGLPVVRVYSLTGPAFEAAAEAIQRVVDINVAEAQHREEEALARSSGFKKTTIALLVCVLLAVTVLMFTFYRLIYNPIKRLRALLGRYPSEKETLHFPEETVREIHETSQAFRGLIDRLERLNEQKVAFLAAVAHDLRNPLGAIQMSVDLLEETESEQSPAERAELIGVVDRQVTQLRRLLDDILDTAQFQGGQVSLSLQRMDLRSPVRDAGALFRSTSAKHDIRLDLPAKEVPVNVDPTRIGQVMNNLVSNAIKYSPDGGIIEISLRQRGNTAYLGISDQGMGIGREDLPFIFEPFRRTSASRKVAGGLGLGLAATRRIVEAHRGRIDVRSVPHEGTTFLIELPLAETQSASSRPMSPSVSYET